MKKNQTTSALPSPSSFVPLKSCMLHDLLTPSLPATLKRALQAGPNLRLAYLHGAGVLIKIEGGDHAGEHLAPLNVVKSCTAADGYSFLSNA